MMKKRFLSIALFLALLLSMAAPVTAAAEENPFFSEPTFEVYTPEEAALELLIAEENTYPAEMPLLDIYSGTCGEGVTWTLDENGTLTISGTGDMADYVEGIGLPWADYREHITKLVIEEGVTGIGICAFYGCINMTSVSIPDTVTKIDNYAFTSCYGLKSFYISPFVTDIGTAPFNICRNLEQIDVDPNNTHYISQDGVLYNKDKTELISYPAGKTNKDFTIPDSVINIAFRSFYVNRNLESVVIPDSVNAIGGFAFQYCANLCDVKMSANTSYIGNLAFSYTAISDIAIAHTVTEIGQGAFNNSKLQTIHYAGSQEDWQSIVIRKNNDLLSTLSFHYLQMQAQQPTCITAGIAEKWVCPTCEKTIFEGYTLPPTGEHDLVAHDAKAPSCTQAGWEAYETCNVCDFTTYAEIPAPGHSFVDGICTVCGKNEHDMKLSAAAVKTTAGKDITVLVNLDNNPGINTLKLSLGYDSSIMRLVSATDKGLFESVPTASKNLTDNPYNFVWVTPENTIKNGALIELVFHVSETAEPSEQTITLAAENVFNENDEAVDYITENISLTITKYEPGDANGDGLIDLRDASRILQYLVGWDVTLEEDGADTTGDGMIDVRDATRLLQYFAGWDVQLGK